MIYSATHRQSALEYFLNLLPNAAVIVAILWIGFTNTLIALGTSPLVWLFWAVISVVVGTVIHEGAHFVAGILAGRQVRTILIGGGHTIFTVRAGNTRLQVCSNLLDGGAVMFSALDQPSRRGLIVAIAAGPGINLVAGAYALAASRGGAGWLGEFGLFNLLLGVTNFIPSRFSARGQDLVTDGMQILRLARGRTLTGAFFEGEELAPDARRVMIGAIEEARDAGSDDITAVHVLAALNRDPEIRRLLAPARVDELVHSPGPSSSDAGRPLRTETVDAIEKAAFHIARDAGVAQANAAFLCLALMSVPSPVAMRLNGTVSEAALRDLAVSRSRAAQSLQLFQPEGSLLPDLPLERWGTGADRALELAFRIATVDRAEHTGTHHLLAALAAERDTRAGRALLRLGFALKRNDKLVPKREAPFATPRLSPQATTAIAGALLRTGPTYPTGSGELALGVCDQGRGMGAFLFLQADISSDRLLAALRLLPREQSDPIGFTPSMRRLWELRASARLGAGRYADSLADFRVLETNAQNDEALAVSRNNVAWTALRSGDPALRAEALAKSRAALAFKPDQRSFQGTYGFALLENGSPADAADVLERVTVDHPRPRDRALDLCLLAICRARLGDIDAAARHLAEAEAADPKCTLLARAKEELTAGAATPA